MAVHYLKKYLQRAMGLVFFFLENHKIAPFFNILISQTNQVLPIIFRIKGILKLYTQVGTLSWIPVAYDADQFDITGQLILFRFIWIHFFFVFLKSMDK